MKYCSTSKENDTVIYATWMDLENIKLGEISQIRRTNIVQFFVVHLLSPV